MAESDASESSVLGDLNLSDQIEAELSEEGGSIYVRLRVGQYNYNRTDMSHIVPTVMKSRVPRSLPTTISRPKPKAVDTVSNLSVACKTLSGTHFYDTFNCYCIQNGYTGVHARCIRTLEALLGGVIYLIIFP